MHYLDPETTQRVWQRWLEKKYPNHPRIGFLRLGSYGRERARFESWLWSQGASLRQKNKQMYIEFVDGEDALCFLMKN